MCLLARTSSECCTANCRLPLQGLHLSHASRFPELSCQCTHAALSLPLSPLILGCLLSLILSHTHCVLPLLSVYPRARQQNACVCFGISLRFLSSFLLLVDILLLFEPFVLANQKCRAHDDDQLLAHGSHWLITVAGVTVEDIALPDTLALHWFADFSSCTNGSSPVGRQC